MIAHNIKQHVKNVLLGKTSPKYVTKLVCIVSSHLITDFSWARQNVSEKCPELTKFLPNEILSTLVAHEKFQLDLT